MRLWSIHPCYLDSKGLVALWREGLLAQKVLRGETKGYKKHPQLLRFKETQNSFGAIADYLRCVADEADTRKYRFDRNKIISDKSGIKIKVSTGQLKYEFAHLLKKLKKRSPEQYMKLKDLEKIEAHPTFKEIPGDVESWEIT